MGSAVTCILISILPLASGVGVQPSLRKRVSPAAALRALRCRMIMALPEEDSPSDGTSDENEYSIDWDSAWQLELAKQKAGTASWRPEGREPPESEDVVKARLKVAKDTAGLELQQLAGDWRFWIGIVAVFSVVTAVLGHSSADQGYTI